MSHSSSSETLACKVMAIRTARKILNSAMEKGTTLLPPFWVRRRRFIASIAREITRMGNHCHKCQASPASAASAWFRR